MQPRNVCIFLSFFLIPLLTIITNSEGTKYGCGHYKVVCHLPYHPHSYPHSIHRQRKSLKSIAEINGALIPYTIYPTAQIVKKAAANAYVTPLPRFPPSLLTMVVSSSARMQKKQSLRKSLITAVIVSTGSKALVLDLAVSIPHPLQYRPGHAQVIIRCSTHPRLIALHAPFSTQLIHHVCTLRTFKLSILSIAGQVIFQIFLYNTAR